MTEPFRVDPTAFANLSMLEPTLCDIVEMYRDHLQYRPERIEKIDQRAINPIREAAGPLANSIEQMRRALRTMIDGLEGVLADRPRDEELKQNTKSLLALDESLRFILHSTPGEVAEAKFVAWLNRGKVPYLPIRQDFFSFHGQAKARLKRPDFIVYNKHEIVDDIMLGGTPNTGRILDSVAVDVKSYSIKRDTRGSYFRMPDSYSLIAQLNMDDKAGARSFWCIVPPELENFAIVIDLLHLHGHLKSRRPGERIYFRDIVSMPINMLHLEGDRYCFDPVEILFLFDQLNGNFDYTEAQIEERKRGALSLLKFESRLWNFLGIELSLPFPDEEGTFIYETLGGEIIADDEREAALVEHIAGHANTGLPIDMTFLEGAFQAFPTLYGKTKGLVPHLRVIRV